AQVLISERQLMSWRARLAACRTRSDPLHPGTIRSGHTYPRSEGRDMLTSGTTFVTPTGSRQDQTMPDVNGLFGIAKDLWDALIKAIPKQYRIPLLALLLIGV